MHFERGAGGSYKSSSSYTPLSLTTADTHDMVPLAGFWQARDVELRVAAGLIPPEGGPAARQARDGERRALLDRLAEDGAAVEPVGEGGGAALRGAVHDFLCRSPAALVGLSYDDVLGEVDPVNVPGVGADRYPSWTRRTGLPLERISTDPEVARSLGRCRELRGRVG